MIAALVVLLLVTNAFWFCAMIGAGHRLKQLERERDQAREMAQSSLAAADQAIRQVGGATVLANQAIDAILLHGRGLVRH